jgi:hypothetical protein
MSLTAAAVDLIWDELQSGHSVVGSFGEYLDAAISGIGGGVEDWTSAEREQIRSALGIDGTKTAATGGQLQALPQPGDIWDYDLDSNYAEGGDLEKAGGALHFLRQMATNIVDEQPGNPGSFTLRNDADSADIGSWEIRDFTDGATVGVAGAPAKRGEFTL